MKIETYMTKPTDTTPKIALLNVSVSRIDNEFKTFVLNLHRNGYELVSSSDDVVSCISDKMCLPVTPRCQINISRITLFVLDKNAEVLEYKLPSGNLAYDTASSIVRKLYEGKSAALVITDSYDYDWLINKMSNVQGVRPKDRSWMMLNAAFDFGLKHSTVSKLIKNVRPRTPETKPAH